MIVDGPYDINKNGKTESFVLNDPDFSIKWIEFEGVSKKITSGDIKIMI